MVALGDKQEQKELAREVSGFYLSSSEVRIEYVSIVLYSIVCIQLKCNMEVTKIDLFMLTG